MCALARMRERVTAQTTEPADNHSEPSAPVFFPGVVHAALERQDLTPLETPLRWPCAFLGCRNTRVFDGETPGFFNHLGTCKRCGSQIAVTPHENAFVKIVARDLL